MSSTTKNINSIIETWAKFEIELIKRELDDKVIEIAQQLEEGDQSRKKLIEQTKEFRRNLSEDQRKLIAPILKSFQVEVDSSNKRSKLMEQVLLKLYKQLIDLPDPAPALNSVERLQKKCERLSDLEIENKQLRETLDEYNVEFKEVKNQEVTIKALKDKIKEMEEKAEQQVQQKIKEKQQQLQKAYTEFEEQSNSKNFDLVKKLGEAEAKIMSLQAQLNKTSSELFDFKSKHDEILNAKSCEIDLLLQDLDKMTDRAVNAERLSEQYMQQMATYKQQSQEEKSKAAMIESNPDLNEFKIKNLEMEINAKEKQISQLVDDIQKLQAKSSKSKEFYESQRGQLEEKLNNRERTLEQIENELRKKADYDEIQRELNILKSIEFNLPMESMASNEASIGAPSVGLTEHQAQQQQKPLEILLLEKNHHLQNENMHIKTRFSDIQLKYDSISKEHSNLGRINLEQKGLIVELEKDLLKLSKTQAKHEAEPNIAPIVIDLDSPQTVSSPLLNNSVFDSSESDANQSDMSLFDIVSSQRERFKIRVQELETENISNKQQIAFVTNELDRLRSDNVKLYEKIKFIEASSKKASYGGGDDDLLGRYTSEYERSMDPFTKFNYQEKQKRYTDLKLHDKFTLNLGRFILYSKTSRIFFFAYFLFIFFNFKVSYLVESENLRRQQQQQQLIQQLQPSDNKPAQDTAQLIRLDSSLEKSLDLSETKAAASNLDKLNTKNRRKKSVNKRNKNTTVAELHDKTKSSNPEKTKRKRRRKTRGLNSSDTSSEKLNSSSSQRSSSANHQSNLNDLAKNRLLLNDPQLFTLNSLFNSPSSLLTKLDLKTLFQPALFESLPRQSQLKLIKLLPECDRKLDSHGSFKYVVGLYFIRSYS